MKKSVILTVLAAMSICMTACGEAGTTTQSGTASTAAVTEAAASTAADTTAAVQTSAAQTTAAAATAAQTAATTASAKAETTAAAVKLNEADRLFGGYVETKNDANLNLRAKPDESADILVKIPNATQLSIYACDTKGWYLTEYKGKTGYVSADYIKEIPASGQSPETTAASDAKPNAEGFYDDNNLPATSVSVAALNGTWVNEQGDETLTISAGSDIYHGKFTLLDQGNVTRTGNVQIQYLLNQGNIKEYCFTFYEDDGKFVFAFHVTDTIQCNDIYGYQSGEPHFIRQAD